MFAKNINSSKCRSVDYILSPCSMTTNGLLAMLEDENSVEILNVEGLC